MVLEEMVNMMRRTNISHGQPLVSIVTPSYNQGRFIEETILSVKNQDYPNIEHIIVDGGSKDNTLEILKKYKGTYNMRWISEPDKGRADAVNKGFAMAQGEIIGWLNSDDVYLKKDTLRTVVHAFQSHTQSDVVYGDAAVIDIGGRILQVICLPKPSFQRLLRSCYLIQPAIFFRRHVIKQHQLDTKLQFAMDYEFWLMLGKSIGSYISTES